jgi:hypothetical protein
MDLDRLAAREMALLRQLATQSDRRSEEGQKRAIQDEYAAIYAAYRAAIRQDDQRLEALKRAAFLPWNEPA